MDKKVKAKVPSYFTEEEKKLYKKLSKDQRGHIKFMREDQAKEYLYRILDEKNHKSGKDIMNEIADIANNTFDDNVLSKKVNESDMQEKEFNCKFCGQAFRTEDMRDKHQRICI